MKKEDWANNISEAMKSAGTYQDYFSSVIDTLASILERRDQAQEDFERTGGNVIVRHTNKAGATNLEQNPILRLVNDLNRDALAYWRDLGLTPAGLKRINENALQKKTGSALGEVLKSLEDTL